MIPRGSTATNAFFVNKEVLDEVGLQPATTYSEMVAQVPILREAGYDTLLMANEATWVMQSCLFSLIAGRFMGEDWHLRIHSGEAKFTDPEFVAALEFVKQMYDDGVLSQSTLATDYGSAPGLFATNRSAYYIDGDWRVGAFITDPNTGEALIAPERQENFFITVFPEIDLPGVAIPARTNTAVPATGWGLNANLEDGSPELEAAWTLLKWLVGNEAITYLVESGGIATPSRTDINFDALTLEPLQIAMANLGNEFDKATVVIDGVFEGPVYTPLNDGLQAVGLGSQTPQQVAELTQAAFEAWLETQE
jgi:raffinose/stachyose/melibiose transport system substrate-binding protein